MFSKTSSLAAATFGLMAVLQPVPVAAGKGRGSGIVTTSTTRGVCAGCVWVGSTAVPTVWFVVSIVSAVLVVLASVAVALWKKGVFKKWAAKLKERKEKKAAMALPTHDPSESKQPLNYNPTEVYDPPAGWGFQKQQEAAAAAHGQDATYGSNTSFVNHPAPYGQGGMGYSHGQQAGGEYAPSMYSHSLPPGAAPAYGTSTPPYPQQHLPPGAGMNAFSPPPNPPPVPMAYGQRY